MDIDLKLNDLILTGRWKNKKVDVKSFGKDDNGQPTVNGKPMLKFRIAKLMPDKKLKEDEETLQRDFEGLIKKYGLYSPGRLLSFRNDPAEYICKGLTPDRKGLFVTLKNRTQTYKKRISDLIKVDRKPILLPVIESLDYLKEMEEDQPGFVPKPSEQGLEFLKQRQAAAQGSPIEMKFQMDLANKLKFAFSSFLDTMSEFGISKDNIKFDQEFKVKYPANLSAELKGLYYKFTQGGSDLLKGMTFEQLIAISMEEVGKYSAKDFYLNLKNIVMSISKRVITTLKQESMTEGKDLKIKVLVDKVLSEAMLSKRPITEAKVVEEETLEEAKNSMIPDDKDAARIDDILYKSLEWSNGRKVVNKQKAFQLASNMANAITDIAKAYRRYKAAEDENMHQIALIFYKRYSILLAFSNRGK
jgi:hypothetical protein